MYDKQEFWGFVDGTDTIHIDADEIYEDLSLNFARRKNDWNFGLLHELSHLFEDDSRPWDFHAEVLADYKLAYVMTKQLRRRARRLVQR